MSTLKGLPLADHYRDLRETRNHKYAWKVIDDFFEAFDEDGARENLWTMLTAAMKLENEEFDGRDRSDMIFFYEYSVAFFDAVSVLYRRHVQKSEK